MPREIDVYEPSVKRRRSDGGGPEVWRRIWGACSQVLIHHEHTDFRSFHYVIQAWMPIINSLLSSPISSLERYSPKFFCLEDIKLTREILQVFTSSTPDENGQFNLYIVFNANLFRKVHNTYCSRYSHSNHLVDLDRGVVNLDMSTDTSFNSTDFLKRSSAWYILFVSTCHMLAHLDTFEKYDTKSYENHDLVRRSAFFKLCVYGTIKHNYK